MAVVAHNTVIVVVRRGRCRSLSIGIGAGTSIAINKGIEPSLGGQSNAQKQAKGKEKGSISGGFFLANGLHRHDGQIGEQKGGNVQEGLHRGPFGQGQLLYRIGSGNGQSCIWITVVIVVGWWTAVFRHRLVQIVGSGGCIE